MKYIEVLRSTKNGGNSTIAPKFIFHDTKLADPVSRRNLPASRRNLPVSRYKNEALSRIPHIKKRVIPHPTSHRSDPHIWWTYPLNLILNHKPKHGI